MLLTCTTPPPKSGEHLGDEGWGPCTSQKWCPRPGSHSAQVPYSSAWRSPLVLENPPGPGCEEVPSSPGESPWSWLWRSPSSPGGPLAVEKFPKSWSVLAVKESRRSPLAVEKSPQVLEKSPGCEEVPSSPGESSWSWLWRSPSSPGEVPWLWRSPPSPGEVPWL